MGRSNPAIIRSVVVLPQPDGPSSEKNSPGGICRLIPIDRAELAEALHEVDELDLSACHGRGVYRASIGEGQAAAGSAA